MSAGKKPTDPPTGTHERPKPSPSRPASGKDAPKGEPAPKERPTGAVKKSSTPPRKGPPEPPGPPKADTRSEARPAAKPDAPKADTRSEARPASKPPPKKTDTKSEARPDTGKLKGEAKAEPRPDPSAADTKAHPRPDTGKLKDAAKAKAEAPTLESKATMAEPTPASPAAEANDPFAGEADPLAAAIPAPAAAAPATSGGGGGDDDFDALGFDTSFGANPGAGFGGAEAPADQDETPPAGVFMGEEVQVLSAQNIGRALAEADGEFPESFAPPEMGALQTGLIGVDIGASAATVACFNADGQHEIVPNQDDERVTPVQLFFDEDGEQLVGHEARRMAASAPSRAIVDLKEMIADPFFRLSTGGQEGEIDSQTILGMVLKRLLDDVERHLGKPATHVALAAPAWFAETQRETLRRAVERTGVTLVGITDESLAAAVPYSLRLPDLAPRVALVFDLGHAALGVALVRCAGGDITILAADARRELGSSRWDLLIAQEAARKFKQAHGFDPMEDKGSAVDLKLRAEDAKRELSRRTQVTLTASSRGKAFKVGFTRAGLEEAAKGLVQKSLAFAREVRDRAKLDAWSKVDALILTGGGSRTPIMRAELSKEVGREPERGIGAEEGVAIGALYWGTLERHRQSKAK